MIGNSFKTSLRALGRQKQYTVINVLGLAVGLASCLLMAGYVLHELSFESMHAYRKDIYRVNSRVNIGQGTVNNSSAAAPLGLAVKDGIPEVEEAVRLGGVYDFDVTVLENAFKEKRMFFSDPQIFRIFTMPLLQGNPETALSSPYSVVIDSDLAHLFFGNKDPMGQTIRITIGAPHEFLVTGVLKPLPTNTVLRARMWASFSTLGTLKDQPLGNMSETWTSFGMFFTFLQLKQGAAPAGVESKLAAVARPHLGKDADDVSFYLQPLSKIYLQTNRLQVSNDFTYSGSPERIAVFSAVAFLILLIAGINFINLSTARVARRMKEVGVRKTCGAGRSRLALQFLGESVMLSTAGMAIGIALFQIFKARLDAFVGRPLSIGLEENPALFVISLGLVLAVGLIAGSYPAFYLSRFPASVVFRSTPSSPVSRSILRTGLVVFQFVAAIGLIASTLGILKQINYAERKDLGFDKMNTIALRLDGNAAAKAKVLKSEILAGTPALSASSMYMIPAGQNRWIATCKKEGSADEKGKIVQLVAADADFLPTFGVQLKEGRNFDAKRASDAGSVLLNEAAVKDFGLDNPVGQRLIMNNQPVEVIGVVKDFHTNSLHSRINPTAVICPSFDLPVLTVRYAPGRGKETLEGVQAAWRRIFPDLPFAYETVEDIVDRAYDDERKLASLLMSFCGLAVFVAALGVFGLASFSAEQRTKEIGIRKVLGAGVSRLTVLLARSFGRWALLANIVAWPAAYYVLTKWLQAFAFRTPIGLGPFIGAGLLTLGVALLAVGYHAVKAALADPIQSLRYE